MPRGDGAPRLRARACLSRYAAKSALSASIRASSLCCPETRLSYAVRFSASKLAICGAREEDTASLGDRAPIGGARKNSTSL